MTSAVALMWETRLSPTINPNVAKDRDVMKSKACRELVERAQAENRRGRAVGTVENCHGIA
jgi:hypothetical protein